MGSKYRNLIPNLAGLIWSLKSGDLLNYWPSSLPLLRLLLFSTKFHLLVMRCTKQPMSILKLHLEINKSHYKPLKKSFPKCQLLQETVTWFWSFDA